MRDLLECRHVTTSPSRRPRIALIILHSLQLLSLAPWLMVGAFSFMVFDAPGSDKNKWLWAFVAAVWSYPLWLLLGAVASWLLLLKWHRSVAAVALAAVFSLPALLLALWAAFLAASSAFG